MPHPLNRAVTPYTAGPGDDKGAEGDSYKGSSGDTNSKRGREKTQTVSGKDFDDWTRFSTATLHILERRLQDILLS